MFKSLCDWKIMSCKCGQENDIIFRDLSVVRLCEKQGLKFWLSYMQIVIWEYLSHGKSEQTNCWSIRNKLGSVVWVGNEVIFYIPQFLFPFSSKYGDFVGFTLPFFFHKNFAPKTKAKTSGF
jgi:hypothetical protein